MLCVGALLPRARSLTQLARPFTSKNNHTTKTIKNTERAPGLLLGALTKFPTAYTFTAVGRVASGGAQAFADDVAALVSRVAQTTLADGAVAVRERLGGKYVSVSVEAVVRAPEVIAAVIEELGRDERVRMKY